MRNFWQVLGVLSQNSNEPIAALTGDPAVPAVDSGGRICEYCKSKLTARGEVLEMSPRARELRTLEDRLIREQEDHTRTKAELVAAGQIIADLRSQLAQATEKAKSSGLGLFKS